MNLVVSTEQEKAGKKGGERNTWKTLEPGVAQAKKADGLNLESKSVTYELGALGKLTTFSSVKWE